VTIDTTKRDLESLLDDGRVGRVKVIVTTND